VEVILVIGRYTKKAMGDNWLESSKYGLWALSLVAALWIMVQRGKLTQDEFVMVRENLKIDPQRVKELDEGIPEKPGFNHDAQAAIEAGKESLREAGIPEKVIAQLGAHITSYDMEDPAFARQIVNACDLVLQMIDKAIIALKKRAAEHRYTKCVFLTHGQVATPGYLSLRICRWICMLERDKKRINFVCDEITVAKFSGATGINDELTPDEEKLACEYLALNVADGSSQIIHRDRHAAVLAMLTICARNVSQIANDLWLMCEFPRSEAREWTNPNQRGSSAMPHKKNPITLARLRGMSSLMIGYLTAGLEQQMTYDEREIDQSSVERVIWPDATILLHYMLETLAFHVEKIIFFPQKMLFNLESVQGIWASQYVKNALWDKGIYELPFYTTDYMDPDDGEELKPIYVWVQSCAFAAWDRDTNMPVMPLKDVFLNQGIESYMDIEELDRCFDVDYVLRNADAIYDRCGISEGGD
jgi:adenylosuccinate lyase